MFRSNNGNSDEQFADSPEKLNRIVEGTLLKGDIKCESNIRIDGAIEGTVETNSRLVIGENGKVNGDIICQNGDIEGTVEGTVKVNGILSLKSTATIHGDIHTEKLAIEPGAIFTGNCTMGDGSQQSQPQARDEQGSEEGSTERTEEGPE